MSDGKPKEIVERTKEASETEKQRQKKCFSQRI
jgi:hypothetical protein